MTTQGERGRGVPKGIISPVRGKSHSRTDFRPRPGRLESESCIMPWPAQPIRQLILHSDSQEAFNGPPWFPFTWPATCTSVMSRAKRLSRHVHVTYVYLQHKSSSGKLSLNVCTFVAKCCVCHYFPLPPQTVDFLSRCL